MSHASQVLLPCCLRSIIVVLSSWRSLSFSFPQLVFPSRILYQHDRWSTSDVTQRGVRTPNHCCSGKSSKHTYCVCVCVCVCVGGGGAKVYSRQCACAILSFVSCVTLNFYTLPHKRHDVREKVTVREMCVLIFCTAFVSTFLVSKNWTICECVCKVLVVLVRF
jgi:hypothetical protein